MSLYKSTEEEVLEHLIQPLEDIFGELQDGIIRWAMKAMRTYDICQLITIAHQVIRTSEWSPKPATIIKAAEAAIPKPYDWTKD